MFGRKTPAEVAACYFPSGIITRLWMMFGNRVSDKKLGELLLQKSIINSQDLEHALKNQDSYGVRLGEVLEADGKISAYELHQLLAEQYQLPFVDLTVEGCDALLLEKEERENYLKQRKQRKQKMSFTKISL